MRIKLVVMGREAPGLVRARAKFRMRVCQGLGLGECRNECRHG